MGTRLERLSDFAAILASLSAMVIVALLVSQRFIASEPSAETVSVADVVVENWEEYASAGHRIGATTPAITIIEFGDYQCAYCREWQPHIEAILRKYPDDVAFVYRHFPLESHALAYPAARAAECAGEQGRFWPFHRQLLGNSDWIGNAMTNFAISAGIQDMNAFEECLDDESPVPAIDDDLAAAMEVGAPGTPAILINGVMSFGVVDSLRLEAAVQRVLP